MIEDYYTAEWEFSRDIPVFIKSMMIREYVRMRNYACEKLNPNYEKWNEVFHELHGNEEIDKSDPYFEYGGIKYCKFISEKQKEVFAKVNKDKEHSSPILALDSDETCDIFGRCKIPFYTDVEIRVLLKKN